MGEGGKYIPYNAKEYRRILKYNISYRATVWVPKGNDKQHNNIK